jgi:hypothetical protein
MYDANLPVAFFMFRSQHLIVIFHSPFRHLILLSKMVK